MSSFKKRTKEILRDNFVEQEYKKLAQVHKGFYLRNLAGFGKWLAQIDYKLLNGLINRRKYNRRQILALQNIIECEAHRELILAALKGERENER